MINVILFSFNRPAQLDLTLSSYKKYFKEWKDQKTTIIYKYSKPEFKAGYEMCKRYHPEFVWVLEENYKKNTLDTFNTGFKPYTTFLVDDDVFVDYISLEDQEIKKFMSNDNFICLSPRISPGVNFCYTQNKPQLPPKFIEPGVWNWTDGSINGDWCYPLSIAGFHLFKTSVISPIINRIEFRAPNSFEGSMEGLAPRDKNLMICYQTCKVITGTDNKVQTENGNSCDNTHSVDDLNSRFLSGKRLSTDANHKKVLNMCHGPLKLEFV